MVDILKWKIEGGTVDQFWRTKNTNKTYDDHWNFFFLFFLKLIKYLFQNVLFCQICVWNLNFQFRT